MPYTHGASRIKLTLCPKCLTYRPAMHPCPGRPPEEDSDA